MGPMAGYQVWASRLSIKVRYHGVGDKLGYQGMVHELAFNIGYRGWVPKVGPKAGP